MTYTTYYYDLQHPLNNRDAIYSTSPACQLSAALLKNDLINQSKGECPRLHKQVGSEGGGGGMLLLLTSFLDFL